MDYKSLLRESLIVSYIFRNRKKKKERKRERKKNIQLEKLNSFGSISSDSSFTIDDGRLNPNEPSPAIISLIRAR